VERAREPLLDLQSVVVHGRSSSCTRASP
jgi:hypothetical protein